jgi:lipopolysaccharide/colanic/teichoic acid biosynthesis glycosyltransferase
MKNLYKYIFKGLTDFIAAVALFLLLSPLLLIITLILIFYTNGHPFFLQKRVGKDEKVFTIIKFRSLKDMKDLNGNPLPDHSRMYPFGTWLRITHLDELPQLINILKGELSFLGPRPLHPEYLEYYAPAERIRHNCKPGIAGLSQIMAGNFKPWDQRLRYDRFYVLNMSFSLDMYIITKFFTHYISNRKRSDLFCESFIDFSQQRNAKA